MNPAIFLIGLPGSGKTTLGRALAPCIGATFIDLDTYIECRFHSSVAQLFASRGEDGFRLIERNMLREVAAMNDVVVACGGGTPCFFDNMELMLSQGIVIHLVASRERLHSRLCRHRHTRPHLASLSDAEVLGYIDRITLERQPFYSRAHMTFPSSQLEDRDQIQATVSQLVPSLQSAIDALHTPLPH